MFATTYSRLEQLSNELLLEIFEYLNGYDLYQAFYGLNHRITTLLKSAQLCILDNLTTTDETVWNILLSFIDRAQVRFLSINDLDINKRFLPFIHQNLRSIRLTNISANSLDQICQQLPVDNQIKSLRIQERYEYYSDQNQSIEHIILVKYAQQLHSLVNLSLHPCVAQYHTSSTAVIFQSLRHLCIRNYHMTASLLEFLNQNMPSLRSLKFIGHHQLLHTSITPMKNIEELHISANVDVYTPHNILFFLPSLRRLHIDWTCNRQSPFDGRQWQQLMERHMPQLQQWTVVFLGEINQDKLKTFYTGEFWTAKKVKVKMSMNKAQSRHPFVKSIYFGREWHFGYINDED